MAEWRSVVHSGVLVFADASEAKPVPFSDRWVRRFRYFFLILLRPSVLESILKLANGRNQIPGGPPVLYSAASERTILGAGKP
uniref:Putative secreted protein n=1 Tax=Anopheles marajoara TaxID=58244 RepID=A0A2M4CBE8_9DIPT